MMNILSRAGLAALAALALSHAPLVADDLPATEDAMVRETLPTTNFGRNTRLNLGSDGGSSTRFYRGYFKFDVSAYPRGARVVLARLYWYQSNGNSQTLGFSVEAHTVTSPWQETAISWATLPTFDPSPMGSDTIGDAAGWRSWGVKAAVQRWIDGTIPNHGILLKSLSESPFAQPLRGDGWSREAATRQPYLRVEIETPTLPGTGGAVFWNTANGNAIRSQSMWGSGPTSVLNVGGPVTDIEVDASAGHVYWINAQNLVRSDLDGGNLTTLATGLQSPHGLALDVFHGKVYWTETATNSLKRANLDGTSAETVPSQGTPGDVAIDPVDARIYYNNTSNGHVIVSDFDGSARSTFIRASVSTGGLAIDHVRRRLMWTNASVGSIASKSFDGGGLTRHIGGLNAPSRISFDSVGDRVAWTGANGAFTAQRNGADRIQIATSASPNAVAIAPLVARAPATVRVGRTVTIDLVGSDANTSFSGAASFGTSPGFTILGNRTVPLNVDAMMLVSLGTPSVFQLTGTLDAANGAGRGQVVVPAIAELAGTIFSVAFVTIDPQAPDSLRAVSNAVTIEITS